MKKIKFSIIILSVIALFSCSDNKKGLYEEAAINALDDLTEVMGQLKSCSFTLNTSIIKAENGIEPTYKTHDLYMRGSDKMYYYSKSNNERLGHWYNGEELAVFNFASNKYDIMDAPATIMETINLFNKDFKVTFPAADFFYPSLTDDIIQNCDTVIIVGTKVVDEVECIEINATNENVDIYILIEKETSLPKALAIYYMGDREGEHFLSMFSNWRKDPNLPDNMFMFSPPENSTQTSILTSKLAK